MRIKSIMILATTALFAVAACKDNETPEIVAPGAPVLEVSEQTATSFTVAWEAVEGADMYTYEFGEDQTNTDQTSVSFADLASDSTYVVRVKSVSTANSTESDWAEISVSLVSDEEPEEPEFALNLETELDGFTLVVTTTPSETDFPYYFEPIPGTILEGFGDDAEAMFANMMDTYQEYYGNAASAFAEIAMTGNQSKQYDLKSYVDPEYYVLAAGIDENLDITTAVEMYEVLVDVPVSDNEFTITIDECTQSYLQVTVTPSNGDQYALILQDKETVDGLSEAELETFLLSLVTDNSICTNKTTMQYSNGIVPSHDYSVLVFGYEDGIMTTVITRQDVRTPDPVVDENLTFEFNIEVLGPQEAYVEIVPSSPQATYFYDVMSLMDWAMSYQYEPSMYIEDMAADMYMSTTSYLKAFGSVGTQSYTYDSYYLSPGTEYVLFAIGYSLNDDGTVTYFTSDYETFETPEETGGDEPSEDLGFFLQTYALEAANDNAFYVDVIPTDKNATYVYAVMTDLDYDEYFPDSLYDYFYGRYEDAGFDGSFAEYISSIMRTGDLSGYAKGFYEEGTYYYRLVAAGVAVEGDNVTFYNPMAEDYFFEILW